MNMRGLWEHLWFPVKHFWLQSVMRRKPICRCCELCSEPIYEPPVCEICQEWNGQRRTWS